MFENDLKETDAILGIVNRTSKQRFRKALNRGERRLEFVGYVGHKIAAHTFELAQVSDVVQHDDRPGSFHGANRGHGHREEALTQRSSHDFGVDSSLSSAHHPHRLDQLSL